jgi:hypothetical protein
MNKYASTYINAFNKTASEMAASDLSVPEIDPLNNPEGQWRELPNNIEVPVAKPTTSPLDYLLQAPPAVSAPVEQPPAAQLPSLGSPGELPLPQAPSLIGIPEPTTLNAGNQ